MREIWEAILRHPWIAGLTGAVVLGGALKLLFDKFILEPVRDLIFAAAGKWLGISDVNMLVAFLSYALPIAVAALVVWGACEMGRHKERVALPIGSASFSAASIPQTAANVNHPARLPIVHPLPQIGDDLAAAVSRFLVLKEAIALTERALNNMRQSLERQHRMLQSATWSYAAAKQERGWKLLLAEFADAVRKWNPNCGLDIESLPHITSNPHVAVPGQKEIDDSARAHHYRQLHFQFHHVARQAEAVLAGMKREQRERWEKIQGTVGEEMVRKAGLH